MTHELLHPAPGPELSPGASQMPLPAELIDAAASYVSDARAKNTRELYARAWRTFSAFCTIHSRTAMPATLDTIAAWMSALAQAGRAPSTINAYLSAVVVAHRTAGHTLDRQSPLIADVWKGIRRTTMRVERQARPLVASDIKGLLDWIGNDTQAARRDAAILALGWAAALRRSELIGLDWLKAGSGSGFVEVEARGLVVTLLRAKANQDEAVTVVVPASDMPVACTALADWIARAGVAPGEPIFRPVDRFDRVSGSRLTDRSIARLIKGRVLARAAAAGAAMADAEAIAAKCSGHSLRAGYVTAAAHLPTHRIMQHSRHKSAEMVTRYIRESNKWTKGGLNGVGF